MKSRRALLAIFLLAVAYFYITQENPVYCISQNRVIPDDEFIKVALNAREAEVAFYGGIDAYEKHFLSLNRHPNEAGRDFDSKNPNAIEMVRGSSAAKSRCAIRYPVCVSLNFPKLEGPPTYGSWRGRVYYFNECGSLREYY